VSPSVVSLAEIEDAARRIAPFVRRTPLLTARDLVPGCELLLKCENLQVTGAFKARGAHNATFRLDADQAARGVATHSSGNHGAALALAARNRGVPAHVVMPSNAPDVKKDAVAAYGAEITFCEPTLAARTETLERVVALRGSHVVHPYEDLDVIRGQGTVGVEILDQAGATPDVVIAPVGGGGLLGGIGVAVKSRSPGCVVIGAEPAGADDAFRSFRSGVLIPQESPDTIADGLLTSLGRPNFALIEDRVDDIVTVDDDAILAATRQLIERAKLVVEPSGAVAFAAVSADPDRFAGRRVAVVLSGGNVDLRRLPWLAAGPG